MKYQKEETLGLSFPRKLMRGIFFLSLVQGLGDRIIIWGEVEQLETAEPREKLCSSLIDWSNAFKGCGRGAFGQALNSCSMIKSWTALMFAILLDSHKWKNFSFYS